MPPYSDEEGSDPHPFAGIRFALVGFDDVSGPQYRLELERAGGTDAGDWKGDCTHVIVFDRLYDDQVCVAARNDGKKVVTEQWVDDSLDLGELADANRVLYEPLRGSGAIPGSESLVICLTGYQKDMREYIMKLVYLMGATFSRPLKANEVTHLICYKFEGEKYDIAKQVNVKLVNHRWLEDCLKAWEILPINNYTKSSWEVEIMEAEAKDSEDETKDAGRGSSSIRRISRSNPVSEIRTGSHFDSDVNAPTRGPTIASSNADGAAGRHLVTLEQNKNDASTKSFDIRADSGKALDTNNVTVYVHSDAHNSTNPHIGPSENDEGPTNQVASDAAEDDHNRATETSATALCTPSVHGSIPAPIQADNIENINGNCLQNSNQVTAKKVPWPNSSEENLSRKKILASELSRKVDQKDDGHTSDLKSTVPRPYAEEKLKLCESNVRSEGNSTSRNNHILGYSRKCSSKSVSPDTNLRSAQQTASPQSSEGNTSRVEFNTPPRKHDQELSKPADAQSLQETEVVEHVGRSRGALAQRRKSILSSASPKPPSGDPDSGTSEVSSLIPNKESASEGAAVSNLDKHSAECTKVGHLNSGPTLNFTEKQISGSFKSNLLSTRRTSLKLVSSAEAKNLSENSNDKNMVALGEVKAPALHKATIEKGCAIRPSVNSEGINKSSGVSLRIEDIDMSDAEQVNNIEVAAPNSELDKVVSHQSLEAGPTDIPVSPVADEDTMTPCKVSTSRVRNAGTKRSRNASSKSSGEFAKRKHKVAASKQMHDKALSHGNVEDQQGAKGSSPNAAESTPLFSEEILNGKPRNEVSKAVLANVIPEKNMREVHKKLSSSASAVENLENSSQRVPNSVARNSVAKGPQTADDKMADSSIVDKSVTMSLKFDSKEVVPPENGETYPKRLSSSASADDPEICTANKVPNGRARKVVAKRKLSAVQKQKSSSERCKAAGDSLTEDKVVLSERAAQSSRNAGKLTLDQDLQNTNRDKRNDPVGSFCRDAMVDRSKHTQSSKSSSNKRQKIVDVVDGSTDHDKENIPVGKNLTSKTKYGNNNISSKSITKALPSGRVVHNEDSVIKGNDCGTLNVLEPTWFILSGHRLLRKEYMSILKRLKGRVCRHSHHWSFQATHLVTTELRRTEKFFAAAAAGRWILKPEYLTACNNAGKFLEEEPFEWHGHGLNSSETISLDAPRKWRQHKQRTGHGAFYGMQIIIYGECIAPTLDTLKRAIRSGDGTVLATSPPYTRFFKSNVDFAVVSEGMPSVDGWVQEFMRHNIPCITADYLVEYVCKPGHPLTKHVLFNMHDLAEKSLQKLTKNQRDGIGADTGEGSEGYEADLSCSAYGSNDRDRLMLKCGSDGNPAGCGVSVHVDCCNLPVEAAVPVGNWLCPKCEEPKPAKKAKNTPKSRVLK